MQAILSFFAVLFFCCFAHSDNSQTLVVGLNGDDGRYSDQVRQLINLNQENIKAAKYFKFANGSQKYCITFKSETDSEMNLMTSDLDDIGAEALSYKFSSCEKSVVKEKSESRSSRS